MSAVVILGMHKSGTTLIAETLHRSGVSMIEKEALGSYDTGNKMEREETRTLNMDLLNDGGTESLRLVLSLSDGAATESQFYRARSLVSGFGATLWGFKDPRTLLTFSFWEEVLETPVLVGVFRNPVEVFGHYVRRAGRRWISRDPAYLPDSLRAWCIYNQQLLDLKRRYPNMLLLDYADFMTSDTGMQRLSTHVGRELIDCRKATMRRERPRITADYRLARLIVSLRDGLNTSRIHRQLMENKS